MSSINNMTMPPPPTGFSGLVGAKRRRMRSGGNVSTLPPSSSSASASKTGLNGSAAELGAEPSPMDPDEKVAQTSKCKGATTIPIFLKKTYKMIDTCDSTIASWTPDGEMFVVKDPEIFATKVIPQYFDHNKFSSFARQLNFYGFRKMQSKPIRNVDFDANTAKHVTFYNENFKRGRCDLLKKIQRSTRSGGAAGGQDQSKEVQQLKERVNQLEDTIEDMRMQSEERIRRLELDMLGRMEQMMLAMQQQQQQNSQLQLQSQTSTASVADRMTSGGTLNGMNNNNSNSNSNAGSMGMNTNGFDPLPFGNRGASIGSLSGIASLMGGHQASIGLKNGLQGFGAPSPLTGNGGSGGPTLPPHPKQKQLPAGPLPGSLGLPAGRMDSLRGISTLSRGISNLSRGLSTESQGSAILGNTFEDKFFSMLMNGEANKQAAAGVNASNFMNPTPINMNNMQQQQQQQLQGRSNDVKMEQSSNGSSNRAPPLVSQESRSNGQIAGL
mmetsp:Transcript_51014/g.122986  ORF Transcript_51014/g.122986 Transcript_51014/m.122986 type:complete len:497 (+) Transcript_51014:168-1658(+)